MLVTRLEDGVQRLVREAEIDADPAAEILRAHLRRGKSGIVEIDGAEHFLTVQVPPVRIVINRRGAYQPGLRADGEARRVRLHDHRSAYRFRLAGALPRCDVAG